MSRIRSVWIKASEWGFNNYEQSRRFNLHFEWNGWRGYRPSHAALTSSLRETSLKYYTHTYTSNQRVSLRWQPNLRPVKRKNMPNWPNLVSMPTVCLLLTSRIDPQTYTHTSALSLTWEYEERNHSCTSKVSGRTPLFKSWREESPLVSFSGSEWALTEEQPPYPHNACRLLLAQSSFIWLCQLMVQILEVITP